MAKDLEREINDFIDVWDTRQLISFFRDTFPLVDLYNVDETQDWVRDALGEEADTVRIIRTVYLVSKLCDLHAGRMVATNYQFKGLWKRLEKQGGIGDSA